MATEQVVVGIVPSYSEALRAVHELRSAGFNDEQISVAAVDAQGGVDRAHERARDDENKETSGLQTAPSGGTAAGASTGGVIGAVGGLVLGLGALLIPGIGPIVAAGPLAAALGGAAAGAATGGLVGALSNLGIPESQAREYSKRFERGEAIVSVHTDESSAADAAEVLRRYEALTTAALPGHAASVTPS